MEDRINNSGRPTNITINTVVHITKYVEEGENTRKRSAKD